jgi:hypothetical protein
MPHPRHPLNESFDWWPVRGLQRRLHHDKLTE